MPLTNEGFDMAWKNLVQRYENKRVLVNAQLKSLFNIRPVTKETGSDLRRLQRTINDCITNLRLLNIDAASWDIIFVYICSTCLPDTTLSLWEQSLPHSTNLPTWKELDEFLTSRFHTLESVADIRSTFVNSNAPKSPQINKSEAQIHGLSDSVTATSAQSCEIKIGSPVDPSFELASNALVITKLTEIDLLLGGDVYPKIIQDGLQWDEAQSLVAQKTVFGWIITGKRDHKGPDEKLPPKRINRDVADEYRNLRLLIRLESSTINFCLWRGYLSENHSKRIAYHHQGSPIAQDTVLGWVIIGILT
ncbi:hypothetical protein EVAR_69964_1 [Eumeta japonica]|uniref:Peptidase aspartic putative domain-containing protein n=1 Tax=Eumeta variegata TaxID=151549 RepID=A0A4C2AAP5_EUMVA|nr:hypothetical protein EVAR_69964_1 [Eumeta japonica]